MPPRALLTGSLTVGLVSVPIRVYTATRSESVAFHLLHTRCGSRIQNQLFCPRCGVVVPREELVRGYEVNKDEYVRMTNEELQALETPGSRDIEVQEFVPQAAVDPVYFDRTYYLGPGKGGERGYQLLRQAMVKTGRVAVGKYTMRGHPRLVLLRPVGEGLYLHTLHYPVEVGNFTEVERPDAKVRPGELDLAVRLIEDLAQLDFRPEQYADEYRQRFLTAVEQKRAGGTIAAPAPQAPPPTADLLATLRKSLDVRRGLAKAGRKATAKADKRVPARKRRQAS